MGGNGGNEHGHTEHPHPCLYYFNLDVGLSLGLLPPLSLCASSLPGSGPGSHRACPRVVGLGVEVAVEVAIEGEEEGRE